MPLECSGQFVTSSNRSPVSSIKEVSAGSGDEHSCSDEWHAECYLRGELPPNR